MALEGYLSCGVCHFEGIDDGRVYDFSTAARGCETRCLCSAAEGTQAGPPQLDRHPRRGSGLRAPDPRRCSTDEASCRTRRFTRRHARSTARRSEGRPQPGARRAGRVRRVARAREPEPLPQRRRLADAPTASPARRCSRSSAATSATAARSSRTARAARCTTSAPSPRSPARAAGGPLLGLDTPTLLGVWEIASVPPRRLGADAARRPHHEESRASCTASSARCRRSRSTSWSLTSCRSTASCPCVACRSTATPPPPGDGRAVSAGGGVPRGGVAGTGAPNAGAGGEPAGGQPRAVRCRRRRPAAPGSSCAVARLATSCRRCWRCAAAASRVVLLAASRRRRRRVFAAAGAVGADDRLSAIGPEPDGGAAASQPTDWSKLPAVTAPDPELAPLGHARRRRTNGSARAGAATASPRLCATAASAPTSAIWRSCSRWSGWASSRAFALTGQLDLAGREERVGDQSAHHRVPARRAPTCGGRTR